MDLTDKKIDGGKPFDFGRTSEDYAKYRDIYPPEFYKKIADRYLCLSGQKVLDLGTGTGVLPRNMYSYGADWTGVDVSENQIEQAKLLSKQKDMDIDFFVCPAEEMSFPDKSFDVVTACQCFWYFDQKTIAPKISKMLKDDGKLLVLYMAWLPYEDRIASMSEELVLKYSPQWSGAGETKKPLEFSDEVKKYFNVIDSEEYDLDVHFTRENWHGRMRSCRGVGASLKNEELSSWEKEHISMLKQNAPEEFFVKHYCALSVLEKK